MAGFPADPTPEGTLISTLAPPAGAPVTGNLNFNIEVEHLKVHSLWDTWSHGYGEDVYYTDGSDLLMGLPSGTLAFYLYVQPNLKDKFEFLANSGVTTTTLTIDGDAGAHFVGFYSDNPLDALTSVYVRQTTDDSDGFAVGEFGINVSAVPEPSSWLTPLAALLFLGGISLAKTNRQKTAQAHY